MVEGATIDIASHFHQTRNVMDDVVGLDQAVQVAMQYALLDEDLLIIVTADHETGGMRLNRDGEGSYRQDGAFQMPDGSSFWVDWTTTSHTPDSIPVTAQGPYSEMLSGEYSLTKIFETMSVMLYNSLQ